jgi:hypothetical protein
MWRSLFLCTCICSHIFQANFFEEIGKAEFKVFNKQEVATLNMPEFYKETSYRAWGNKKGSN